MKITTNLGDIKNECFVLMPFGNKFDPIYQEVLRPAIEDVGLTPVRADQVYASRRIMKDIWNKIRTARLVVAELTGRNANVLYELGIAHALGKPFVIITNSMDDVPFDLKDIRCIVYDKDHPKWGDSLISSVTRTMRSVLEEVNEHEPLFSDIKADTKYTTLEEINKESTERTKRKEEETYNLSGNWALRHKLPEGNDFTTRIELAQQGHSLSGYAVSQSIIGEGEEPHWIVSEQVSGFTINNEFELAATSYQFLKSGSEKIGWFLDNWRGTIENENFIHGEISTEDGDTGTFWGERSKDESIEGTATP